MKQAAEQRQKKIEDLEKQIQQAEADGDLDKAAQLQQQKENEEQNNKQQQNLDNIANQLQQAAEAMKTKRTNGRHAGSSRFGRHD